MGAITGEAIFFLGGTIILFSHKMLKNRSDFKHLRIPY